MVSTDKIKTIPLISIIVPIYNVEKYLYECICSVLKQTYNNFELILVNDGSADSSGEICDKFAKKDNRITVIHKENAGVSSARNAGLEKALGKWIAFLDPDDWIEENTLEFAVKTADKNKVDILGWNYYINSNEKQIKAKEICPHTLIREGIAIRWFILDTMYPEYDESSNKISLTGTRNVWGKLFHRNIIFDNSIRFSTNLQIGEDAFFCMQCFEKSQKIMLINEYLSHYRVVHHSANRRYRKDLSEVYTNMLNTFYDHIGSKIKLKDFSICYTGMTCHCIGENLRKNYVNRQNPNSFFSNIKAIKQLLKINSYSRAFENSSYSSFGFKQKVIIFAARINSAVILYFLQVLRNIIELIKYKN